MVDQHKDPVSPLEMDSEGNARKRVCKACDRCRLKKSKCDGASPCHRCHSDNAICVFGERKKAHDKVYPKGYVEMLEQQQDKMVNAIHEMYLLLERNDPWPGPPLQKTDKGFPLTHDLLERLGLLHLGSDEGGEPFEEDAELLARKLRTKTEDDSYPTPNTIHSDFSPQNCETMDTFPSSCETGIYYDQFRPTPLLQTPEEPAFCMDASMSLDGSSHYAWLPPDSFAERQNLSTYDYDPLGITRETANPCLPTYDEFGYTGHNDILT